MAKFGCFDCRAKHDSYMVNDWIWDQAFPTYEAERAKLNLPINLCLGCLQKRLGRQLYLGDFTEYPINDTIRFGYEMGLETARRERE